jgi:CxxC motif-containing protein
MEKVLTCIECPRGCTLTVKVENEITVEGNFCPKGAIYGKNEVVCPVRIITSTVRADKRLIPVKTDKAVKKELIFSVMDKIRSARVLTNVGLGDIIIKDVDGEGANVVACAPYIFGE